MKYLAAGFLLCVALTTSALADNISVRGPDAAPEYKEAINKLNADVAAWNARCKVTNSDAEQSWCEEERAALGARKESLRDGKIPNASAPNVSAYPTVDVTLRARGGAVLKRVKTDSGGNFMLGTFPGSLYLIEFRASKVARLQDKQFAIRIDGIKAKGRQTGILAKYLVQGLGVDVETAPGMPLKGQVTTGSLSPTKRMVWLPKEVGSNIPGHWVEEGSGRTVARGNAGTMRIEQIQRMQETGRGF
jgi:hypothetical protein